MREQDLINQREQLQAIARGDEHAFRIFFDAYRNKLFVFVEQLIHSRTDAEEIVQDVFMQVWQSADRLVEIEQPGHYIYAIARNKTLNYIRQITKHPTLVEGAWQQMQQLPDHSLENRLQSDEFREVLNVKLSSLSPKKQKIFHLSRNEGLTHAEIASLLHISQSRVKNSIVEILHVLKGSISGHVSWLSLLWWLR